MAKPTFDKFVFLTDLHYGFERRSGHKVPLHDQKALAVAMAFIADFKPDHVILGGDMLDCGAISHHNARKPGRTEGLRVLADAVGLREVLLDPLERSGADLTYIEGNHEAWLHDLVEDQPGLAGIVEPEFLLQLNKWRIVPQGEHCRLGKLTFIHGDQIRSGENCAKSAVTDYERNVRFGHFHGFQTYSKTSAVDIHGHTGIAVPCLCKKDPKYGGGRPNKWMQGFLWGYVAPGGAFNDYVSVIVDGQAIINGKVYRA